MIFTTGNLLTLAIVIAVLVLFRQLDRNNRSLDKVRKYGDKLKDDLGAFVAEREAAVKDYAVELDVQRKAAKELLNRLSTVEEGFATRADGIVKIDERLNAYDKSLEELLRMTARAQENLERLKNESNFTDGVLKRVKEAKDQLEDVEKGLGEIEVRFERENTAALERAGEAAIAAVKATASDLQETAETIERRVEDHREAIVSVEKARAAQLAADSEAIREVVQAALREARESADKLEDAAFVKLKDQALERSRRFHEAVEEKLGQFQEASKARLVEVQTLVKSFKSDWQKETAELAEKQKAYRDEWKKEVQEVRAAFEGFKAAIKNEGQPLVAEAAASAKSAANTLKIEFASELQDLRAAFDSIREDATQTEQTSSARVAAVSQELEKIETDFKRRAAALEEATRRVEEHALASAGEDAARRQGEIHAAVETSIAAVTDRLTSETTRIDQGIRSVETSSAALAERLEAFVKDFSARLSAAAEEAERKALTETDQRLDAYRAVSAARFERLEALADDVGRMDAELRRAMGDTEQRVRSDFALFEKDTETVRAALRSDMEGVEQELAALKTKAYENVSEKLKLFEDDFFADLSKRSDEIDRRLTEWKAGVDASLVDLGASTAAERERLEASFVEQLKLKLAEYGEKFTSDLERLKEQTAAFEEGIREQTSGADISVQAFKEQMLRDLEEARSTAAAATKAEIGKNTLAMSELLKKDQRELEESLKTLINSVEARKNETAERLESSRRDLEAWQASVTRQLRDADGAVEEARRRARELAAESDERLAATRAALQEARDEASAHRTELLARTDEQVKTLDASVKDVDRRLKEFLSQTKLFDRADELKIELERRIEDLGADLDRLDQRKSEAAELEAQFVKIKRLEDEVNAKMTRFLSEKRRIELMEADFKRLIQTAQSVDEKLAQVTSSDDTLQNLQAQMRRLDDAAKEADLKIERVEKRGQIVDQTVEGIDRNFQALRDAEASAKRIEDELKKASATALSVRDLVEKIAIDKDKADEAIDKVSSLDSTLSEIEERIEAMQKAREWLARTETRLAEVSKQAQDQVKIMGTLLKSEGKGSSAKDRGAPPLGVRETVVKLAHQGWSIDEIARAVKLSKGEVELILEISPKG